MERKEYYERLELGEDAIREEESWPDPVPLTNRALAMSQFPTWCLPKPVADYVEALAEFTQTPPEMGGLLSLGVLACAFQSKFHVEVTPNWTEPLCLYCVAVAPPGERKSAVLSALTRPLGEYEARRREAEAADLARSRTERELLERELEAAKAMAAKGTGDPARDRARALELSEQLAGFKDRAPYRLLVDDTTPEKLVDLMDSQKGCITVCSAEGGIFDAMQGRYDRNAGFDVYLKGHAGDPITVDRIGRAPNRIPDPRLTMLLTIQPEVLSGLMNNTTFRGRGLCGRFLYAICNSKVGHREVNPLPIPEEVKRGYEDFLLRILSMDCHGTITVSHEADLVRQYYQDFAEARLATDWEDMRDWGGKLTGAMVRIAALLHAATAEGDPTATPLTLEAMNNATHLAEFLSLHAEGAYQLMGADRAAEDAKYLLRRLMLREEMSRTELTALCRGRFKRAEDMEPGLRLLADYGYIRKSEQDSGYRNHRHVVYLLNPKLWS